MTGTDEMHDDTGRDDAAIDRIAAELRVLPLVRPEARARVLVALAAERERAPRAAGVASDARRRARVALAGSLLVGLAAAGLLLYVTQRGSPAATPTAAARTMSTPAATLASTSTAGAVAVQLVLRAPAAARVAVVGDFTGWDQDRVPMTRDPASGLWSATVRVVPGRHVYAFVADDSVWMRDPRAPVANDADFGRPGSVLLVGRP